MRVLIVQRQEDGTAWGNNRITGRVPDHGSASEKPKKLFQRANKLMSSSLSLPAYACLHRTAHAQMARESGGLERKPDWAKERKKREEGWIGRDKHKSARRGKKVLATRPTH